MTTSPPQNTTDTPNKQTTVLQVSSSLQNTTHPTLPGCASNHLTTDKDKEKPVTLPTTLTRSSPHTRRNTGRPPPWGGGPW